MVLEGRYNLLVGGDFIMVPFPTERVGNTTFTPAMQEFLDFVSYHGLVDIPLEGGNYTW
jgi:hypothetical protein